MFHPKKLLTKIGPGVITGASDDDPSGIVTYSQTGAQFGYGLLWLALFTTPLMIAAQEMSARLGLVTRQGLAKLIKKYSSRKMAMVLVVGLLIANIVNIGADLSAMAAVTQLLLPGPLLLYLIIFAAIIILLEIFVTYAKYVNVLKWLTLALFTYVIAAFTTHQEWLMIIKNTFIPTISHDPSVWMLITAILGTTISPYLFFWQASEEIEEEKLLDKLKHRFTKVTAGSIKRVRWDTIIGMLLSNIIMFFIIVVTAGTLHQAGVTNITTASQAAEALRPIAGSFTFILFALGIIGTGLLAIPVLAGSAAYALSEMFDWHEGLSKTFNQARNFYITIIAAIAVGGLITLTGVSPIKWLIYAAVLNGLLAPVILWFMLRLSRRSDVMGKFTSPPAIAVIGWIALITMTVSGVMTIWQLII